MEKSYIDLKNTFKTLRSIDASKINQVLAESIEDEIKEENTDETTVEENVLKKPRTRKARKDVE